MIKDYYTLTKPGIIYGNIITVIAGFVLASQGAINSTLLIITILGISLVIASGCVFNNYIDRDIDAVMERTKNRALVRRVVSPTSALLYGSVLGFFGMLLLVKYTNVVTVIISAIGFFVYVVVYSMYLKRTSVNGVLIGSIAGAVPLVVGYVAVTGTIDFVAVILFLILALWQMPHSYAIAIRRLHDYEKAKIPVLPVKEGIHKTKVQILVYAVLFVLSTLTLPLSGHTGWSYLFVMLVLGISFIALCAKGLYIKFPHDEPWARKVFLFSIVYLVVFCLVIVFESMMK